MLGGKVSEKNITDHRKPQEQRICADLRVSLTRQSASEQQFSETETLIRFALSQPHSDALQQLIRFVKEAE